MQGSSSPKRVFDILKKKPEQINISCPKPIYLPLKLFLRIVVALFVVILFIGSVQAPQMTFSTATAENGEENGTNAQEERIKLENELKELERQIIEHQNTIQEYQKQGKTLKNEINALNTKINQLNLQIKAINLNLEKLSAEITNTQKQINRTENKIELHKNALGKAIRSLYEADSQSLIEILLANDKLSDFFGNINNITLVQSNLKTALNEVIRLREELLEQKQELSLEKEDVENLKSYRESQKRSVANIQKEKANLLEVTKGRESEYQKLLKQTQETAAQIRSRIFRLLGGGELTFEEAYNYARLAEGATGVRAAFILAILHQESLLGQNVGRCQYNQIISWTGKPAMHPTRDAPYFLELLGRLGIDPNSTVAKVSCPNRDGTYGGAMGPAQFIPSTWKLYENDIAKITGTNPPNPWNNADAFVAAALYLKNSLNSRSCQQYADQIPSQRQILLERCAAAQYYSGNRWYTYRWVYGEPVATKAIKFQQDINILTSS